MKEHLYERESHLYGILVIHTDKGNTNIMEIRKRKRGELSRQILASITPEEHARTYKQMAIAARIAEALKAKGWSKSEFATRMNQQPSVVTRWLSGTQNFTLDTLSDIEEMLGVQLLMTSEPKPAATEAKPEKQFTPIFIVADASSGVCHPIQNRQHLGSFSGYIVANPSELFS